MARTMTDEHERRVRGIGGWGINVRDALKSALAELDAERAAHEETKARLALAEAVCELVQYEDWTPSGATDNALAAWRAGK